MSKPAGIFKVSSCSDPQMVGKRFSYVYDGISKECEVDLFPEPLRCFSFDGKNLLLVSTTYRVEAILVERKTEEELVTTTESDDDTKQIQPPS